MKLGEDTDRIVPSSFKLLNGSNRVQITSYWHLKMDASIPCYSIFSLKKAEKSFYWFNIFKNLTPTVTNFGEDTERIVLSRFKWLNGSNRCPISNHWCLKMAKSATFQTREPQKGCGCFSTSYLKYNLFWHFTNFWGSNIVIIWRVASMTRQILKIFAILRTCCRGLVGQRQNWRPSGSICWFYMCRVRSCCHVVLKLEFNNNMKLILPF